MKRWLVRRLYRYLGIPAEDQGLAFAFMAPIGVLMPNCDPVQPDYIIVLQQNVGIIHDRRIWGVPGLIVEVLSPGNKTFDERIKFLAYAVAGVPEYAIINPATRSLNHYRLDSRGRYAYPRTVMIGDTITFDCLPTLSLPIAELFAGAPDTTP
ncbi:MAG: Uma2 family endonuclease [Herpetosiphonaceae bacterium]|nr:Uma2 family endonuclease [Herpetosiphonaceae bacterium]